MKTVKAMIVMKWLMKYLLKTLGLVNIGRDTDLRQFANDTEGSEIKIILE